MIVKDNSKMHVYVDQEIQHIRMLRSLHSNQRVVSDHSFTIVGRMTLMKYLNPFFIFNLE